jgi:hypothetical protein
VLEGFWGMILGEGYNLKFLVVWISLGV